MCLYIFICHLRDEGGVLVCEREVVAGVDGPEAKSEVHRQGVARGGVHPHHQAACLRLWLVDLLGALLLQFAAKTAAGVAHLQVTVLAVVRRAGHVQSRQLQQNASARRRLGDGEVAVGVQRQRPF